MVAVLRGLLQGRDTLAEVKGYPTESIVKQLKAELPDSVREAFGTHVQESLDVPII